MDLTMQVSCLTDKPDMRAVAKGKTPEVVGRHLSINTQGALRPDLHKNKGVLENFPCRLWLTANGARRLRLLLAP